GKRRYDELARAWLARIAPLAAQHPGAFAFTLGTVMRVVFPPVEIAVRGDPADPATVALRAEVNTRLLPTGVTLTAAPGTGTDLSPLLQGRGLVSGRAAAYVCEGYACRQPVTEPLALRSEIDAAISRSSAAEQ